MADALVLAGAVAKGGFTAGALSVLSMPGVRARLGLDVQRVVGASSGALNALYYAAAIRGGLEVFAGARLVRIWIEEGTACRVFDISLRNMLTGRGISSHRGLLGLLRKHLRPRAGHRSVDLRLVLTNLDGDLTEVGGALATSHEHVARFTGTDLDSAEGLERASRIAAASAALPGLFAPAALRIGCRAAEAVDGGVTDNAPVGQALAGAFDVTRVFVIAAVPRVLPKPGRLRGLSLASHLLDVMVQERLVRELRAIEQGNARLRAIDEAIPDDGQRAVVLDALGWRGLRPVQIVEIRPDAPLPGNALSGFFSRALRERYVEAGAEAARRAVRDLVIAGPPGAVRQLPLFERA
ncbi:MAG TPA: patatin-like phospholipase family protein [Polyangiaceae bacterium]|jgi:predicted acylesterase/phospholipase RssA